MLKLKRICDCCEKVIKETDCSVTYQKDDNTCVINFFDGKKHIEYDLCDDCAISFMNWASERKNPKFTAAGWSDDVRRLAQQHMESLDTEQRKTEKKSAYVVDKTKIVLAPGTHTRHNWTKEEEDIILNHSLGKKNSELAEMFGTTISAIVNKKHKLLNKKA